MERLSGCSCGNDKLELFTAYVALLRLAYTSFLPLKLRFQWDFLSMSYVPSKDKNLQFSLSEDISGSIARPSTMVSNSAD